MSFSGAFCTAVFHGSGAQPSALSRARKDSARSGGWGSRSRNPNLCDGPHILGAVSRIVCRYRIWEMTMRLIRFAIGMSLVAGSVLGSARAQSPAELSQVSGQEALTNRFESPVSEMDRLSDRRQLNAYFFARPHDRLR